MTFLTTIATEEQRNEYIDFLKVIGALSGLFSNSNVPYLYYRIQEKLFCKIFEMDDLSRSDISIDCKKDGWGIGLKTFSTKSPQKIAEFNEALDSFSGLSKEKLVAQIALLRNKRIDLVKDLYGDLNLIYHNAYRKKGSILIYENPLSYVSKNIKIIKEDSKCIHFFDNDTQIDYNFSRSKSTLYQKFPVISDPILEIPIKILDDPFKLLLKLKIDLSNKIQKGYEEVILPLYSTQKECKFVHPKSGLNQWNAGGRLRDPYEVYIPIPSKIRNYFPSFFPSRDESFNLILPDKTRLIAKVCQDGGKALMSNPNIGLGKWLLKKILKTKQEEHDNEIVEYKHLLNIGVDSILLKKVQELTYEINFMPIGSYELFLQKSDFESTRH